MRSMEAGGLGKYILAGGVVYGPVRSRRMGVSLGVNILPFGMKLCSFDCPYCQCGPSIERVGGGAAGGPRFPAADEVEEAVFGRLLDIRGEGIHLDSITFSGNGEPTLHPDFFSAVRTVLAARDRAMPGVRVDILTNGAHLDRPGVVDGLNLLDERHVKLDAGGDAKMREVNRPPAGFTVDGLARNLSRLKDFIIQAMFIRGACCNAGAESVGEWIEVVGRLGPKAVHIYSLDRVPAEAGILPVERSRLEEIAAEVRAKALVPAEVF